MRSLIQLGYLVLSWLSYLIPILSLIKIMLMLYQEKGKNKYQVS